MKKQEYITPEINVVYMQMQGLLASSPNPGGGFDPDKEEMDLIDPDDEDYPGGLSDKNE